MERDVLTGEGGLLPVGNNNDRGGKREGGGEPGSTSGSVLSPHTSLDVLGLEENVEGMHPQQASQSDFWMSGFLKA